MIQIAFAPGADGSQVIQALAQVRALVANPGPLMEIEGRTVNIILKNHFRQLDRLYPNKMGARRSHFWQSVGQTVQNPNILAGGKSVEVAINHPVIAHKVGVGPAQGTITPKNSKWLAIPVVPEAYDKRPMEYANGGSTTKDLFFFKKNENLAFLIEHIKANKGKSGAKKMLGLTPGMGPQAPAGKGFNRIIYILIKKVHQDPFPAALPLPGVLAAAIELEAKKWFKANLAKVVKIK